MRLRIQVIILFFLFALPLSRAQKSVTIKECYDLAFRKAAINKEKESYNSIWKLRDANLAKSWLPSLDANASMVYNSEVIDMSGVFSSIPIPGLAGAIKPLPHDQYKVTVDINQVIYDGGTIKLARQAEKAELNANTQQTEIDLYKVRSQVNTYFFSLLLLDKQKELLESWHKLLTDRLGTVRSAADNGLALKSDVDVIKAEMIKIEQQIDEASIRRKALSEAMADLTGLELTDGTVLVLPDLGNSLKDELNRPELKLFDLRKEQLNTGIELARSKRMPKAFGFATLGYGNPPGSNFFRDEFAPYYIVGAGIKWNIYDWNKVKNEKAQIKVQQEILDNRKTDLTDNLRRSLQIKSAEISSLETSINRDRELISIRERVTAAATSQYENGTITATELLNEINSQKQAEINFQIHRISLELARIEYRNISGNEIE
ncbi:MAG: TolC family protein [Bacteroidales bacterium]